MGTWSVELLSLIILLQLVMPEWVVVVVGMVVVLVVVVAAFAYPRLPLVEVMDGGEIVGVWWGDLTRERRRPLTRAAGSVSDLVVFGGLLLLAAP
jgi:hypothetical protein